MTDTLTSTTSDPQSDEPESPGSADGDVPPEPELMSEVEPTTLEVVDRSGQLATSTIGTLRIHLLRLAPLLPRHLGQASFVIVDDAEMARLHQHHMNDPSTTDVLTFDLSGDPTGSVDCEIILCADEARRRAVERDLPIERELLLYAVHGLLHCCGFDDHDPKASKRMHTEEDRLLTLLGVGPTYQLNPTSDQPGHDDGGSCASRDQDDPS